MVECELGLRNLSRWWKVETKEMIDQGRVKLPTTVLIMDSVVGMWTALRMMLEVRDCPDCLDFFQGDHLLTPPWLPLLMPNIQERIIYNRQTNLRDHLTFVCHIALKSTTMEIQQLWKSLTNPLSEHNLVQLRYAQISKLADRERRCVIWDRPRWT